MEGSIFYAKYPGLKNGATTLSKMTLKIMTRSVKGLFATLSISTLCIKCHNAKCHYDNSQILFIVYYA
jgi:hypothetical protein